MNVLVAQTRHKLLKGKFNRLTILDYSHRIKYNKGYHYFYKCICDCGKYSFVNSSDLKSGKTRSCGCIGRESRRKGDGEAAFNSIYSQYKSNAYSRKIVFDIKIDLFKTIIDSPCYYCGKEPSNIKELGYGSGDYIYNGIDRVDNNLGYVKNNCVPCCKQCNIAKHTYSLKEFKSWIGKVYSKIYSD